MKTGKLIFIIAAGVMLGGILSGLATMAYFKATASTK